MGVAENRKSKARQESEFDGSISPCVGFLPRRLLSTNLRSGSLSPDNGSKEHGHVDGEADDVLLLMEVFCRQKITPKDLFGITLLEHVERAVAPVFAGLDFYGTKLVAFGEDKVGFVITVCGCVFEDVGEKRIA